MRSLILLLAATLLFGLSSCERKHDEVLPPWPELTEITQASLFVLPGDTVPADTMFISGAGDTLRTGDSLLQRVQLRWTQPDSSAVDQYNVYVGLFYNYGFGIIDTVSFYATTQEMNLVYVDPSLALRESNACETVGLCDSLYKYSYFRISAVRGSSESPMGERAFPGWH